MCRDSAWVVMHGLGVGRRVDGAGGVAQGGVERLDGVGVVERDPGAADVPDRGEGGDELVGAGRSGRSRGRGGGRPPRGRGGRRRPRRRTPGRPAPGRRARRAWPRCAGPSAGRTAASRPGAPAGVGGDHHAAGSWRASTSSPDASVGHRAGEHAAGGEALEVDVLAGDPAAGRLEARPGRCTTPGCGSSRRHRCRGRSGPCPAATAAPAPPLDPPGVCPVSHGLRVMPRASLSVKLMVPNSEVVVLPSSTKPASTNRLHDRVRGRARPPCGRRGTRRSWASPPRR